MTDYARKPDCCGDPKILDPEDMECDKCHFIDRCTSEVEEKEAQTRNTTQGKIGVTIGSGRTYRDSQKYRLNFLNREKQEERPSYYDRRPREREHIRRTHSSIRTPRPREEYRQPRTRYEEVDPVTVRRYEPPGPMEHELNIPRTQGERFIRRLITGCLRGMFWEGYKFWTEEDIY